MKKFNELLEKYLMPISRKLSENTLVKIITKSMIGLFPLSIAGSLALIIQSFPFLDQIAPTGVMDEIYNFLGSVSNATLSLVGIFLAALIGYYYMKEKKNIEPIMGAMITISSFSILTPFHFDEEWAGFIPMEWLGGQGLFTAMIVGLGACALFSFLIRKGPTIKLPSSVPPMVAEPFQALIPACGVFFVVAALRYGVSFTSYGDIHNAIFTIIQQPLLSIGASLPATLLIVIFIQLLWFMGLHGQNIIGAVMNPIWMGTFYANLAATTAGQAPEYIFTGTFFTAFVWMQFISLIIACLIAAKSAQLKAVARISAGSAVFNISEPLVFGTPVVLNVALLIPWVVTMVVFVLITWFCMATGFCPLTTGADIPWTTPPLLSGFLTTGSIMGAVVQLINLVVGVFIYLPFVKVYDKQLLAEEKAHQEESVLEGERYGI